MKKNKKKVDAILLGYNKQLYSAVFIHLHNHLLHSDKKYFKDYCLRTGISERKLKAIFGLKYNGTLPDIMVILRNAGLYVDLKFVDEKNKNPRHLNKNKRPLNKPSKNK